jgi:hypothetical protein
MEKMVKCRKEWAKEAPLVQVESGREKVWSSEEHTYLAAHPMGCCEPRTVEVVFGAA